MDVASVQSGDLIFFRGSAFSSLVTALFDGGTSHIGMVHKRDGKLFVMHSASRSSVNGNKEFAGVQITSFDLLWKVHKYAKVEVRRIENMDGKSYKACCEEFLEWYGTKYDASPVISWICLRRPEEKGGINCIQLIAMMLSKAKLVGTHRIRMKDMRRNSHHVSSISKRFDVTRNFWLPRFRNNQATQDEKKKGRATARRLLNL